MTEKQTKALAFNKAIHKAVIWLLYAELLYVIISLVPALPIFFKWVKNWEIPAEDEALLAEKVWLNPADFQFLFFIALLLLIVGLFRRYHLPDEVNVKISSKFYSPINVNFNPSGLFEALDADPEYSQSLKLYNETKVYEHQVRQEFLKTSAWLLLVFYLSSNMFEDAVIDTIISMYKPGNLFASVADYLFSSVVTPEKIPYFTGAMFDLLFSCIVILGIVVLIMKYRNRNKSKVEYSMQVYDKGNCYCKECGYACVDILKLTSSKLFNKQKVRTDRSTSERNSVYEVEKSSDGRTKNSRRISHDEDIWEFDVFSVTYTDQYNCENCHKPTNKIRKTEEKGEKELIQTIRRNG